MTVVGPTKTGAVAFGLSSEGADCSTGECGAFVELTYDGRAWTSHGPFDKPANREQMGAPGHVAKTPTGYVAIGNFELASNPLEYIGRVWLSADGINWTSVDTGKVFEDAVIGDVVATPTGLIAVGGKGAEAGGHAAFWTSTDGKTWTALPDKPEDAGSDLLAVEAGGPGFVAAGRTKEGGAAVWTSTDGTAWTRVPDAPALAGASMSALASSPTGFAAIGFGADGAAIWISSDGLAWTRIRGSALADARLTGVAGGPVFVAVGSTVAGTDPHPFVFVSGT